MNDPDMNNEGNPGALRSTGKNLEKQNSSPPFDSTASKAIRLAFIALCALAIAYVWQFFWILMDGTGQHREGQVWQVLAEEVLNRQPPGEPPMHVYYAGMGRGRCNFWGFEAIWGNCSVVIIKLDIKDYRPEYSSVVDRQMAILGNQLHKPCNLISELALKNAVELRESIGCSGLRKRFTLHISVHEITVASGNGATDRSNNWFPKTRTDLNSYYFEGEY